MLTAFHDETCTTRSLRYSPIATRAFPSANLFVEATATMLDNEHKNAPLETRSEVSAYARDPSDRNAAGVEFALGAANALKKSMWQQHCEKWLRSK